MSESNSHNKKWLTFGCLGLFFTLFASLTAATLGLLIGLFIASYQASYPGRVLYGEGREKIALVYINGIILEETPNFSPFSPMNTFTNPRNFKNLLRDIEKDPDVKALVIRVNSPGGSAVASEEIYQAILDFKSTGRVVVVSMGDVVASGGYYVSAAADKIVASPATLTGSIGVIAEIINIKGLYEKLGLKSEVYKSGEYKDILSPARERTEEEKAMLKEILDTTYELFLNRVSIGRDLNSIDVRKLAEGKIYSGKKAKELGLVDQLGGLEEAVSVAKNLAGISRAQVVEYRQEGFLDILFGGIRGLNPLNLFASFTQPYGVSVKYLFVY